jgi:glycerate 2-kinase
MPEREHLDAIRAAAVEAADPVRRTAGALRLEDGSLLVAGSERIPLDGVERILVVAAGKAAPGMAAAAVEALGGRVAGGIVVTTDGSPAGGPDLDRWEAGHPLPDARSVAAAAETLRLARAAGPRDLVLCLLSGGASALWAAPPAGIGVSALRAATAALLRSGAPIGEVNAVRRHLSRIGGGGLARAAVPARLVTLAISDVIDAGVEAIGSGPTVADPDTFADALEVLARHEVDVPPSVLAHLRSGERGDVPETARPGDPALATSTLHVIASLDDALAGAVAAAERLGYPATVVEPRLAGEAREAGARIAAAALAARGGGKRALLFGGETTVTVRGNGLGGRNQEVAVSLALGLEGTDGVAALAFGTDGVDGPTDAAGGYAEGGSARRARGAGIDGAEALRRNDAYRFLAAAGDLLRTGPTGTNVNDLTVVLVDR